MDFDETLFRSFFDDDRKIIVKEETDSTNKNLIKAVRDGICDSGDIIVCESQSAGRGRLGKSFISPKGGIYFSFCVNNIEYGISTVICGVAVASVLERLGFHPQIKWVNDIFIEEKKVSGILAQAVGDGKRAVMGVGINISSEALPSSICDIATALDTFTSFRIGAERLVYEIVNEYEVLSDINRSEGASKIIAEYEKRMMLIGKKIFVVGTNELMTAVGVAPDGALKAIRENGECITLSSGEISVKQID